jgi:Fe-S cluster biogenesis protein NfuA
MAAIIIKDEIWSKWIMNYNLKLLEKIEKAIDQHVRPSLNTDGGEKLFLWLKIL